MNNTAERQSPWQIGENGKEVDFVWGKGVLKIF